MTPGDPAPPPPIAPVRGSRPRPRVSVMLPTYRPDALLADALRSVLAQAPAADDMQITIVDDGSPAGLVEDLVGTVDRSGRVEIVRHGERLGLAGNWNRAIELARGHLVHLLHQDDLVLPGFYARVLAGFGRAPDIGMAFCRCRIVDGAGRLLKVNSRVGWFAGVLDGWLPRIAERIRVQTPAAVVARATYEALGGFRPDLVQALDWEMWVRIAARRRVWFEPRALAAYRRHAANETSRLFATGRGWPDVAAAIAINARSLPPEVRDRVVAASVRWHVSSALRSVEALIAAGSRDLALDTLAAIPDLVRLLPGTPLSGRVRRRFAALSTRVTRECGAPAAGMPLEPCA
ncbi:MAG: glycosyltransferase family 2 protein [Planctomycetaceae bacterium]